MIRNGIIAVINPEKTGIDMVSKRDEISLYNSIIAIAPDMNMEHAAPVIIKNPAAQPSMASGIIACRHNKADQKYRYNEENYTDDARCDDLHGNPVSPFQDPFAPGI